MNSIKNDALVKYLLFFVAFTLCMMLEPLTLLALNEEWRLSYYLAGYVAIIACFAALLLFLICRLLPGIFIASLSVALVGTFFSLKLSQYQSFIALSSYALLFIFIITSALVFICIYKLHRHQRKPGFLAYLFLLVFGLSAPALHWWQDRSKVSDESSLSLIEKSELSKITLKSKPNIYLLSYDSMIPGDVAAKYLEIDLPYQDTIDQSFIEIPHSLSFYVPTMPSISDVMRLGQSDQRLDYNSFAGNSPSILQHLLHKNDYKIITGFPSDYFGLKGKFIDKRLFLVSKRLKNSVLCIAQDGNERLRIFAACTVENYLFEQHRKLYNAIFGANVYKKWHDVIVNQIKINSSGRSKSPVFTYLYTYKPIGHTSKSYTGTDEQRRRYKRHFQRYADALKTQLIEIMQTIRNYDPTALLVVFGDHGAWLSREVNPDEDPAFFYQDRHRIMMAVGRTEHECADKNQLGSNAYQTPSRLTLSILLCLSNLSHKNLDSYPFAENKNILPYIFPERFSKSE